LQCDKKENSKTRRWSEARCWWLTLVILATQEARDQRDHSSKPVLANSSRDPILNKPSRRRVGDVAQGVGLSSPEQEGRKAERRQKRRGEERRGGKME
jgi:hypothetical protein